MKAGDVIKFKGSWATGERFGMLVSEAEDSFNGWWNILDCDGAMVIWPETQIEVVNECR